MPYTTVFFDLDGTLTNSTSGIIKSIQYALEKFDIHEDAERLIPFVGPPLINSFMEYYAFSKAQAKQAVDFYREYFEKQGMYQNELFDGIPELLRKLKGCGRAMYVVTAKPTRYSVQIVRHFGLDQYFAQVIGSEMNFTNADKPTLIKIAMNLHGDVERSSFVMIGDREHDIVGARENGIDSIGVTWGAGSITEIRDAGPTHIVHSVQELASLLTMAQLPGPGLFDQARQAGI